MYPQHTMEKLTRIPEIILSISWKGVQFADANSKVGGGCVCVCMCVCVREREISYDNNRYCIVLVLHIETAYICIPSQAAVSLQTLVSVS